MTAWITALGRRLGAALALGLFVVGCGQVNGQARDDDASGPGSGVPRVDASGLGWSLRDDTPRERPGASAIVDPVGDRLIVFGQGGNDLWSLALSGDQELQWSQLIPEGQHPMVPFQNTLARALARWARTIRSGSS